jgi:replicative DNA helicase
MDAPPPGWGLEGISQRQRPQNLRAEQAFLGALLFNNKVLDRCEFLHPEHFADPINGRIFQTIVRRVEAGHLADGITLKAEFEHSGILEEVGGTEYLARLMGSMVAIGTAMEYARAVHDCWLRRETIEIGEQTVNIGFGADPAINAQQGITDAVHALLDLGEAASPFDSGTRISSSLGRVMEASSNAVAGVGVKGVWTGLQTLDAKWQGLWPGTMDILAGRPGAGKTALALQIAGNAARQFMVENETENEERQVAGLKPVPPRTVEFWSLEMTADALSMRALSMETGIPADDIRAGRFTPTQASLLILARRRWNDLPIIIHDKPRQTLADVTLRARISARQNRMGLSVFDHALKIRRGPGQARMGETEWLSFVASEIHDLAQALSIPCLLLWQLSRDGERREEARPRLSDLKYAGEGDADNVALLWRPERGLAGGPPKRGTMGDKLFDAVVADWHRSKERWEGKAEAVFAKRRSGPESSVVLGFDGPSTKFSDLIEAPEADLWTDL